MDDREINERITRVEDGLSGDIKRVEVECKATFDRYRKSYDDMNKRITSVEHTQLKCPFAEGDDLRPMIENLKGKMFYFYLLVGLFTSLTLTMIGLYVKDKQGVSPADVKIAMEARMDDLEALIIKK